MHYTVFEDQHGAFGLAALPRATASMRHVSVKYQFFRKHTHEGERIMIQEVESKE